MRIHFTIATVAIVLLCSAQAYAQLYFSRDDVSQLYRLSTVDGSAVLVGTTGVTSNTVGLTETNDPNILLASTWQTLSRINIAAGTHTTVATFSGIEGAEGLAFDPTTSSLYAMLNRQFARVNRTRLPSLQTSRKRLLTWKGWRIVRARSTRSVHSR